MALTELILLTIKVSLGYFININIELYLESTVTDERLIEFAETNTLIKNTYRI